jgi:ubiquinone biosynthesis protein
MAQVVLVVLGNVVLLVGAALAARLGLRRRRGTGPARVRRMLESLGPTFMKLGQVLSTRPDLVAPEYEAELARLQDAAPPVPWPAVRAALTRALGAPPAARFAELGPVPLASASIGQVHAARLADGTAVVVKVRRPDVVEQVEIDLRLLRAVARVVARLRVGRRFDPVGLAEGFSRTLRAELDYRQEGANAERIGRELAGSPTVRIPTIVWDHSTEDVLTETRIEGTKIDDVAGLDAAGVDRPAVARAFARAYLDMVFVHRFYHADPHPGNVFVGGDGTIGFVDFGMVGTVDDDTGHGLARVLTALVSADPRALADALVRLGVARDLRDRAGLEADLADLLDRYGDIVLEELGLTRVIGDLLAVVRRRDLRLPSGIALLLKTVMMCEGVAAQVDPGFRLVPLLVPYAAMLE